MVPETGDDLSSSKFNLRLAFCFFDLVDVVDLRAAAVCAGCGCTLAGVTCGDEDSSIFDLRNDIHGEGVDGGVIGVFPFTDRSNGLDSESGSVYMGSIG